MPICKPLKFNSTIINLGGDYMKYKRVLIVVLALLSSLLSTACSENIENPENKANNIEVTENKQTDNEDPHYGKIANNLEVTIDSSELFTEDEVLAAMDAVIEEFQSGMNYTTLTKLEYNDAYNAKFYYDYIKNPNKSYGDLKQNEIMVLLSTFDVDDESENPVLYEGATYDEYMWIVINTVDQGWIVRDRGY